MGNGSGEDVQMQTIFFSWQADCPNSTNRGFIEDCLERAINELNEEGELTVEACIDRDTIGVPGSPDIADSIFDKIDRSAMFVADVSFINDKDRLHNPDREGERCACTRPTPNPNVLTECGYAAKSISFSRVVLVFNKQTGKIEDLPFDLRPRRILNYELAQGQDKSAAKQQLVRGFKYAIADIMRIPKTQFDLQFGDYAKRSAIGKELSLEGTYINLTDYEPEKIPEFNPSARQRRMPGYDFALPDLSYLSSGLKPNPEYYRKLFEYFSIASLYRPFQMMITNRGAKTVEHVRVVLRVPSADCNIMSHGEYSMRTEVPKKHQEPYALMARGRFQTDDEPVETVEGAHELAFQFSRLHPGQSDFSPIFYFEGNDDSETAIEGKIYADDTPPQDVKMTIHFRQGLVDMDLDALDNWLQSRQTKSETKEDDDEDE